ncbi:MAG TPA: hypothetical protein VFF00_06530 [Candidatus Elarobacter sp.]|nr:hypothetical protein [Candidatus Elarobacter sp.]
MESSARRLTLLLTLAVATAARGQQSFTIDGFLTGREAYVTGPPSWLTGGFGRLDAGANGVRGHAYRGNAVGQLGADWRPTTWLTAHAQLLGRAEPSGSRGRRAGVVEAFVELHNDRWRVRAGQFFLGTSRENTDPLWTSRYAQTFSALNTWIGQEFRPVGVDVQWTPGFYGSVGATAFRNNDTTGALLAWRGWTVGNRLTVYDEVLPLPPLTSLKARFSDQRNGTVPFERDLDGRTGYAVRARVQMPERAMLQLAHIDNNGDRGEYRGEYAWRTRFDVLSAEAGTSSPFTVLAEYAWGRTGMGAQPILVDADFYAGYALASYKAGANRWSFRFDRFATTDRDHAPLVETNTEHGRAWAITYLRDLSPHIRLSAEFLQITGDRIAAAESGFDPNLDARTLTLEVRYGF